MSNARATPVATNQDEDLSITNPCLEVFHPDDEMRALKHMNKYWKSQYDEQLRRANMCDAAYRRLQDKLNKVLDIVG